MTEIHFLTIAIGHPKWFWAAHRLKSQARKSGLFSSTLVAWRNLTIRRLYKPDHSYFLRLYYVLRGHKALDSYRWKPIILLRHLESIPEESCLLYLDAGCELNLNPISLKRFNEYLNLLEKTSMLTMALHTSIFDNTSDEVLEFFAISKNQSKTTKMNQSGIIFMINNDKTKELLREWADTAINNPSLFRSSATKFEDSTEFRTGRHDQSILSCLMLKRGFQGIPDETYFGPDWNGKSFEYPIWALRNTRLRSRIRSGDAD